MKIKQERVNHLTVKTSRVHNIMSVQSYEETRCVCETQMPPIMANSNEGKDHKDKYFDTSRKILSQEMTMYNMEAFRKL